MSKRHFGTSAEVSGHFGPTKVVPKCLEVESELSWVQSVRSPMDDESGESTMENDVTGVGRDELEFEWLVRGCRRVAAS